MNIENDWIDYIDGIEKDIFKAHDYLKKKYIKIPGTKYDWFNPTKDRFKIHHTTLCGESILIALDTEKRQWLAAYLIGDSLLIYNPNSDDGIRHFWIPLTKKYTAYSSIVLPPFAYPTFAVLVIKVKNHENNSEHALWELSRFFSGYLNKDLSIKKGFIEKDLNILLDQSKEYLISKKFTDDEIEKHIREIEEKVAYSHRKIIEDSKREFKEIFRKSYLANTPTEKILKDLDSQ